MKYHLISGHRCGSNFVAEILNYNNQGSHYRDPFLNIPWWCESSQTYINELEKFNANVVTLKIMPYSFPTFSQELVDVIIEKLRSYHVVILQRDYWDRFVSLCYKNGKTFIDLDDIHNFDRRIYIEKTYINCVHNNLDDITYLNYDEINKIGGILNIDLIKTYEKPTGNNYSKLITNYDEAKKVFHNTISV